MREVEPIKLNNGQTLLVVVRDGRVAEYTWDMGLPHVEFVKRRFGELPASAWVGTVSKIDGDVVAISSKHFFGYQLPAPEPVTAAVRALFK
jgi:predicted secreted protein